MKLISDAVKDALNGGIDRNCDGVIDKKDRDLMFEEESIKKKASAQYEYVDDEPDEYDTDFDDDACEGDEYDDEICEDDDFDEDDEYDADEF